MKRCLRVVLFLTFCSVVLNSAASLAAGTPTRGASKNGTNDIAAFWNLFGPTAAVPRHNGTVMLRTQVVCTNQQVAAAQDTMDSTHAGGCADGAYTFLFQIQSTATNLTATLSNLVGFTPQVNEPLFSNYGVELCDSPDNTLELCTTGTADQLANITATVNAKNTKIKFTIPSIPAFPAGTGNQGQGLTLVVATQQSASHPVSFPKISF